MKTNNIILLLGLILLLASCTDNHDLTERAYRLSSKSERDVLDKLGVITEYDQLVSRSARIKSNLVAIRNTSDNLFSGYVSTTESIAYKQYELLSNDKAQIDSLYSSRIDSLTDVWSERIKSTTMSITATPIFANGSFGSSCRDKAQISVYFSNSNSYLRKYSYYDLVSGDVINMSNLMYEMPINSMIEEVKGK